MPIKGPKQVEAQLRPANTVPLRRVQVKQPKVKVKLPFGPINKPTPVDQSLAIKVEDMVESLLRKEGADGFIPVPCGRYWEKAEGELNRLYSETVSAVNKQLYDITDASDRERTGNRGSGHRYKLAPALPNLVAAMSTTGAARAGQWFVDKLKGDQRPH